MDQSGLKVTIHQFCQDLHVFSLTRILGVLKVESPRLFHNLAGVNSGQLCLKSVVEL